MKVSGTSKTMIRAIAVTALVFAAAGAVYYRSFAMVPFALGVLLGSALNVGKIMLLERLVDKCIGMEKKLAVNYMRFQYILRFTMTGIVLAISVFAPFLNLWGAAAGIFTMQIAAIVAKRSPPENDIPKLEKLT